ARGLPQPAWHRGHRRPPGPGPRPASRSRGTRAHAGRRRPAGPRPPARDRSPRWRAVRRSAAGDRAPPASAPAAAAPPQGGLVMPLRVLFFGTPAFAVPTLDALLASPDAVVVGAVTQPDKPRGRGQHVSASPIKARAESAGL